MLPAMSPIPGGTTLANPLSCDSPPPPFSRLLTLLLPNRLFTLPPPSKLLAPLLLSMLPAVLVKLEGGTEKPTAPDERLVIPLL